MEHIYTVDPEHTILLFDLHQVLFSHHYLRMVWQAAKHIYLIQLLRPRIIRKTFYLLRNKGSGQELLTFIHTHYPQLVHTIPGIVAIANAQTLNHEMVLLLKQLKSSGYTLHIASNIGQTFFEDLKNMHPDFFALFDHAKVIPAYSTGTIIRKPMPEFFASYKKEASVDDKQIVFIDDNQKHIHAAHQAGYLTILFKNPAQLKAALKEYGIAV
jgi:FMN phosphatase YigB (HAD superfamily)